MRTCSYFILALALISATASPAFEPGTIELGAGISAGFTRIGQQDIFTFDAPDHIRAGVFVLPNTSIVTRLATSVVSTRGGQQSVNSYAFGLCYYFSKAHKRSRGILELMALEDFMTGTQEGSQFGLGLGIGVQGDYKVIDPRFEFVFERWFEGEYAARYAFKLLLGFSFYGGK